MQTESHQHGTRSVSLCMLARSLEYPAIRRNHSDLPHTLRAVESLVYRGNVVVAGPVRWLSQPMRRRRLRRSVLCSLLTSVVFNIRTDAPTHDSLVSDMTGSLFGSSMYKRSFLHLSSLLTVSAFCRGGATITRRLCKKSITNKSFDLLATTLAYLPRLIAL